MATTKRPKKATTKPRRKVVKTTKRTAKRARKAPTGSPSSMRAAKTAHGFQQDTFQQGAFQAVPPRPPSKSVETKFAAAGALHVDVEVFRPPKGAFERRGRLTVTHSPVTIAPTEWPPSLTKGTPNVPDFVGPMDLEERNQLSDALHALSVAMRESNAIQRETAEHVISRLDAGLELVKARTQRGLIEHLLLHPLSFIVGAAVGPIIGELAQQALRVVMRFLGM